MPTKQNEYLEWRKNKFMDKVLKKDGHWLWTGAQTLGYGKTKYKSREIGSHRLSWILFRGELEDLWVLHKCGRKDCVNPEHLYLGTSDDNIRDAVERGETRRGQNHQNSKLLDSDIPKIEKLFEYGVVMRIIADSFGVSKGTIRDIKEGKSWKYHTKRKAHIVKKQMNYRNMVRRENPA